jgi:hypothetical protein
LHSDTPLPPLPSYQIVVDDVTGGEIANVIRGYIEVNGEKIRFKGIAYGRYGGQNVAPRLSPVSKKRIKEVFGSVSRFEEDMQQKLVRGDFEIDPPPAPSPPSPQPPQQSSPQRPTSKAEADEEEGPAATQPTR